jgi:hypothetical protein
MRSNDRPGEHTMKLRNLILALGLMLIMMSCQDGLVPKDDESSNSKETEEIDPDAIDDTELESADDPNSEFGQDEEFASEVFVQDLLATDDEEIFTPASLQLADSDDTEVSEDEVAKEAPTDLEASEDDAEASVKTDLVASRIDFMVELLFTTLDSDDAESIGVLSQTEFVDGIIFPKLRALMTEDAITRLKEWRQLVFDKVKGEDEFIDEDEARTMFESLKNHVIKIRKKLGNHKKRLAKKWREIRDQYDTDGDGKLSKEELQALRDARKEKHKERRIKGYGLKLGMCIAIHKGKHKHLKEKIKSHWGKWQDRFKEKSDDLEDESESADLIEELDSDESEKDDVEMSEKEKVSAKGLLKKFPILCHPIIKVAFANGVADKLGTYLKEKKIGIDEGKTENDELEAIAD